MKYQTIGAREPGPGYVAPNPIDPAAPLPSAAPLPPGSTVEVGTVNTGGWSVEQFSKFVGTGADLVQKAGIDLGPVRGFDFGAAFARIAAASATGAAVGGGLPGAIIGAVLAIVISVGGVWNRLQNPNWYAVGPGIQQFATRYVPDAFVRDAQRDGVNTWQTIPELVRHLFAWWLAQGVVLTGQNNTHYRGDPAANDSFWISLFGEAAAVRPWYASVGVDWDATRQARFDAGNFAADQNVIMYSLKVAPGAGGTRVQPGTDTIPNGAGSEYASAGGGGALVGLGILALALSGR